MRAIVNTTYGSPDVLKFMEVEKPVPKNNEVLVKVQATTVNRTDCGYRNAKPFIVRFFSGLFKPRNTILGSEFAGKIEAVGKDVKNFEAGNQVFGLSCDSFGAHAEYICLPGDGSMAIKPINLTCEEAVAVCEGPWLALTVLKQMNIQKGQRILINGATGSIGSSAVQLAKYYGAEITAVCNTRNLELVKLLGADEVVDYTKDDFTKSNKLYDFVFDAVGKSSFFRCRRLLKKNGVYASTELGYLSQNVFLALLTPVRGGKRVIFPIPKDNRDDIIFFKELAETGKLKPIIDRRYPLEQIAEAYRCVERGQKTGSVVITLAHLTA